MADRTEIPGVLYVREAEGERVPVVIDSPHSGEVYPPEFKYVTPFDILRTGVDMFVDELFGAAPAHGMPLLAAHFPRMFIDPNRQVDDIDPALIDGEWTRALNPTKKSTKGFGLLRTIALPGEPVHAGPLPVAQIEDRIDRYYQPYQDALKGLLDSTWEQFGAVWHIDCHSMKSLGNAMNEDEGQPRPDFVISDTDGTTSEPEFTNLVADTLSACGYNVSVNWPYKGAALIQRYSDPAANRHSIQIEINRKIYMDEAAFERSEGFADVKAALDKLLAAVADYARSRV